MGKLKRFAIGAGLTLAALGGLSALWYRSHYVVPPEPEPPIALPSPNGFDTLQQAFQLEVGGLDGVATSPRKKDAPPAPLEKRLKLLAANEASIARTREALAQDYLLPAISPPEKEFPRWASAREQARMLAFASRTHAESGNSAEGMRCALDSVELGVTIPRGGPLIAALTGYACEAVGDKAAWEIADKLDATTARTAADRLKKIEARRWPLVENLDEDRRMNNRTIVRPLFHNRSWKAIWDGTEICTFGGDGEEASSFRDGAFWLRVQMVYYGPKTITDSLKENQRILSEQAKLPWSTQRRKPPTPPDLLSLLLVQVYQGTGLKETTQKTHSALLQAYLNLRAEFLETGRYPASPKLPPDPFSPTRAPLGYRTDGKTFTLWSVGPDAKDDGGKPIEGETAGKRQQWQMAGEEGYKPGDVVARVNTG